MALTFVGILGKDEHPAVQTTDLVKGEADVSKLARIDTDANVPTGTAVIVYWPPADLDLGVTLTTAAEITDHAIVRGAGGGRGVQESVVTIADNGTFDVTGAASWIVQVGGHQVLSLFDSTLGVDRIAIRNEDGSARLYVVGPDTTADLQLRGHNTGNVLAYNNGAYRVVGTISGEQTFIDKTHTLPKINDTSSDHQYVFAVNELTNDRTVTLPLLTGNDEFVFKDHIQTLTNKTLTTPTIGSFANATHDHENAAGGGATLKPTTVGVGRKVIAAGSGNTDIDWSEGNVQTFVISGGNVDFDFDVAPPLPATGATWVHLLVTQDSTPGRTVTFNDCSRWVKNETPVQTTVAGRVDLWSWVYDGTVYRGIHHPNFPS